MPRPQPPTIPLEADETTTLVAFLDYYRTELLDRAWGLTAEQLRQTHPPSTLNMARLLGHLALVEYTWFAERLDDVELDEPWSSLDWDGDIDAEMTLAETWTPNELRARFQEAIDDARRRVDAALTDGSGLDTRSKRPGRDGEHWSLRWILVHMIEEYARHCGHADLIRESIDGDLAR